MPSTRRPPPDHRRLVAVAVLSLAAVAMWLLAGCDQSSSSFDRGAAVQRLLDQNGSTLTREQAECYVDRVSSEVGSSQLDVDAHPNPSQVSRLTSIRIDCVGVANLARTPGSGTVRPLAPDETSGRHQPQKPGDDPLLDGLYSACQRGDGGSCDTLFDSAAPGSEYEEFAVTCGGRTREQRCADVYKAGSPTPSSR